MDFMNEGHPMLAITMLGLLTAFFGAGKFKSKTLGVVVGVLTFAFFAGMQWFLMPASN